MSKKQKKIDDTYTIILTQQQRYGIKNALMVIDQMNELSCWSPTESPGMLQVCIDMANYIEKTLGIVEEKD